MTFAPLLPYFTGGYRMTFEQQLWLAIADKLVLGALVLIFGYVFNRALERHKGKETVRMEITRMRLSHLSALWADLAGLNHKLNLLSDILWAAHLARRSDDDTFATDLARAKHAWRRSCETQAADELASLRGALRGAEGRVHSEAYWLSPAELTCAQDYVAALASMEKRVASAECLLLDPPHNRVGMDTTYMHPQPTIWHALEDLDRGYLSPLARPLTPKLMS